MDIKQRIKTLLREAELYRSQGLIVEARGKYAQLETILHKGKQIKNRQTLLDAVAGKLQELGNDVERLRQAPSSPEVSPRIQDLIKRLFAFSHDQDDDTAALQGALTLAKFGQYERALQELRPLLGTGSLRATTAKNILRCHLALSGGQAAVKQFDEWSAGDLFSAEQLEKLGAFLRVLLAKKGLADLLPGEAPPSPPAGGVKAAAAVAMTPDALGITLDGPAAEADTPLGAPTIDMPADMPADNPDDECIDISSIELPTSDGTPREMEVSFQTGNMISIIVPQAQAGAFEHLNVGQQLKNIQFFSPIAIFSGNVVVKAKTQIASGPKEGDFSLDLRVESS